MRIVLVRHGRLDFIDAAPISGRAIGNWVTRYDAAGIARDVVPPPSLCRIAATAGCIITSDLRRASESASWIAGPNVVRTDSGLREAPLPRSLPVSLRFAPGAWVVLARLAWYAGVGDAAETVAETTSRAREMAAQLAALAEEHGTVVAVGHGMFNRFLAADLRRRDWQGPRFLPTGYWGLATFAKASVHTKATTARSWPS